MNNKTFGSLSREEQLELFNAWLDGAEIECFDINREVWVYLETPTWYSGFVYRVIPTKPSIDWSAVHPDYKWLARDLDGEGYLYAAEPKLNGRKTYWENVVWDQVSAKILTSYNPGTCDWKDSLVQRPEGV